MRNQTKLLYLTYHENVLGSGILYTQVILMLKRLRDINPHITIVLLSFMSPQSIWRHRRKFQYLKSDLESRNIKFITLPMLIPGSWNWMIQVFSILWSLPLLLIVHNYNINVIHPRGFVAACLARCAKWIMDVKFLFDPRGPVPEEMLMNKVWQSKDATFKIWKRIENHLIENADGMIGVTPEFRDEYKSRGTKRSYFVPNRTDTARFKLVVDGFRKTREFKPQDAPCKLIFIGEMHSVWNDPQYVADHYSRLLQLFPDAELNLFTRAEITRLREIFRAKNLDQSKIIHRSCTPQEMPSAMQGASLGLIFLAVNVHSVWSVKIAEYLAAGIPIIMDKSLIGLPKRIILQEKIGVVVDKNDPKDYEIIRDILHNWKEWSDRCLNYSRKRLDIKSTARQFLRIYGQMLQ